MVLLNKKNSHTVEKYQIVGSECGYGLFMSRVCIKIRNIKYHILKRVFKAIMDPHS